jgi:ubiquinone/menaquinone biosynthesis C-methylase UbiE
VNDSYRNSDAGEWEARFERESREIYHHRKKIVELVGLREGMAVADIGAGTGLFVPLFAEGVGSSGTVYAVDITPEFIEHIGVRATMAGLVNVRGVLCKEDSVELPEDSIDVAFLCDVYHHFEFPRSTMRSLYRALRDGGEVVLIDFIRIEGTSREWVLEHVRAGKETVIREVESFGFELMREEDAPYLEENYVLRFRKAS